jgi:hypothetical protein
VAIICKSTKVRRSETVEADSLALNGFVSIAASLDRCMWTFAGFATDSRQLNTTKRVDRVTAKQAGPTSSVLSTTSSSARLNRNHDAISRCPDVVSLFGTRTTTRD